MASEFVDSQLEKGLPLNTSPVERGFIQQPTASTGSTTLADVSASSAGARRKSSQRSRRQFLSFPSKILV